MTDISCRVEEKDGGHCVYLKGFLNETAQHVLADLDSKFAGSVEFNFRAVDSINSSGVRTWVQFLSDFRQDRKVFLSECPPVIVMELNMIPSFSKGCKVISVYADYVCEECGHVERKLFAGDDIPKHRENAPEIDCPKCGVEVILEYDDTYFLFNE